MEGEELEDGWLLDGVRYPLLTASEDSYRIPEDYEGAVVLKDDREETQEARETDGPVCRFMTTCDCLQLLGLTPFEAEQHEGETPRESTKQGSC